MDPRTKLAQLRSMDPPAALFEPPPSAASEEPAAPASKRPDLRAKLARLRSMAPPAALFEPPPSAASEESATPASKRPDLRAKLARLRSMAPPAALFEPPPPPPAAGGGQGASRASGEDVRAELAQPRHVERLSAFCESLSSAAVDAREVECAPGELLDAPGRSRRKEALAGVEVLPPSAASEEKGGSSRGRADLRAKLARLRSMAPPAALFEPPSAGPVEFSPHKGERIAQLRSLIAEIAARESRRAPASPTREEPTPPPWAQESTDHGPVHVCARFLEPGHHHGHAPVGAALHALPATLPSLVCDADYAGVDVRRALYLDTETTGLAGGTGTVAFLVGLARFEDESLHLEQLVVPQLGSETPMLARLAQRIAAASCIVTYNGKSFDWPLLRTRFVLARLPVPALPPHVDLLHVCRRLWKKRLASVRLVDMEREVLRFERADDLPGSEIPSRYFEFLRGGSPERLAPVLEHNQNDIIALPALLGALLQQYEGDRSLCAAGDALYFGKLALRARDRERARCFGQQALTHSVCPRETRAALTLCAEIEHKLGSIAAAIEFLERGAALETTDDDPVDEFANAQLHFTLAKLYEHEQHDLARALRHARYTELVEGPVRHGRRLGRLYRRLLRRARASP